MQKPIKYVVCEGSPYKKENRRRYAKIFNDAIITRRKMEREYGGKWEIYAQYLSTFSRYSYHLIPIERYDLPEEERLKCEKIEIGLITPEC